MTTVFVLNAGSSSIKYTVLDVEAGTLLADGIVERIGVPGGVPDHATALATVLAQIGDTAIDAVGHRVVHGGERFTDATVIDDDVEAAIERADRARTIAQSRRAAGHPGRPRGAPRRAPGRRLRHGVPLHDPGRGRAPMPSTPSWRRVTASGAMDSMARHISTCRASRRSRSAGPSTGCG